MTGLRVESLRQRIENLEREIESIDAQMTRSDNHASQTNRPASKLAQTYDNGSYPSDPATVYPIMFVDGSFTETAGNQTATWTNRSSTNRRVAYAICGSSQHLSSGTLGVAFRQNGQWWFVPERA